MTSLADIDALQDTARPLGDDVIEMIGTLLAAAARMLTRVSGIGHLIAAALMMLVVTIVTRLPDGLRPWPTASRVPVVHRRWLVAAPARWSAP